CAWRQSKREPPMGGSPRSNCLLQALDAHGRDALEVGDGAIDHIHPIDRALPSAQIERPGALSLANDVADRDVVGLAVGVDHPEIQHLDVGAAYVQADGLEAAFAATDADGVAILAEERHLLAAELDPLGRAGTGRRHRRSAARRLSEHPDDGLTAEVRPRPIEHLDAADVAAIAPEIDRQVRTLPDQPVDTEVLGVAVEVDETDRDHVHVVALGHEPQLPEPTIPVPVLALADMNDVTI